VSEYLIRFIYKRKGSFSQFFRSDFGLSDGVNRDDEDNSWLGDYSNSYAIQTGYLYACWLAGESHNFEFPEGAIQPRWKSNGSNVMGCGIVLNPEDKLWIFFTFNGQLLGELALGVSRININRMHIFNLINFNINYN
jgi:hypothetical protein